MAGGRHYAGARRAKHDLVDGLQASVLSDAATSSRELRAAALGPNRLPPAPWPMYVTSVRDRPHHITDAMVDALVEDGCTDEEIVEVTIAAAFGSAAWRLTMALDALHAQV
jgi:hypothetical protein